MAADSPQARLLLVRVQSEPDVGKLSRVPMHVPDTFQQLLRRLHPEGLRTVKTADPKLDKIAKRVSARINSFGDAYRVAAVIDATRETLPYDTYYDDLLLEIYRLLLELQRTHKSTTAEFCCLTIAVTRPDLLRRAETFSLLSERLRVMNITLFLVISSQPDESGSTEIRLDAAIATPGHDHTQLSEAVAVLSSDDGPDAAHQAYAIGQLLDLDFDHFEVKAMASEWHFPCLVRVARVARDQDAIRYLRERIHSVGGSSPVVVPTELDGSGIAEWLAPQLASVGISIDDGESDLRGSQVVVVADFAANFHDFAAVEVALRARGAAKVAVLALVGTQDYDGMHDAIVSLPIAAVSPGPLHCEFCRGRVRLHQGGQARSRDGLGQFEPVVFWQLLGLSDQYIRAGHWASPRTDNHFWLRVMMTPLLGPFGSGIARRLVNLLENESGVFPDWIDLIVAPDDDEAKTLARLVAQTAALNGKPVVHVPREVLRGVSAGELSPTARDWTNQQRNRHGPNANVLIVDQAAHHLRTYSAVKSVCDALRWHTLAFTVILDRTGVDLEWMQMFHDTKYASLYRWPFPPHHATTCAATTAMGQS